MGILNVTPDSFFDGGKFSQLDSALQQAEAMIAAGVDIIDIGGESTRPGAEPVAKDEEISRVIPVLKAIKARFDVYVSIDTNKAAVMSEAINHGADLINDVCALRNVDCLSIVAESDIPVCLMHMQGKPRTMQENPHYSDIVTDIKTFFRERIDVCKAAGINSERLVLDPGFGFGKTMAHNYHLLSQLHQFKDLGLPLLSGTSRKSMIGSLLNRKVEQRLAGSLATAILAAQNGAAIIRVHDVQETVDAIKILEETAKFAAVD
jgi:dihydropteroate synthase